MSAQNDRNEPDRWVNFTVELTFADGMDPDADTYKKQGRAGKYADRVLKDLRPSLANRAVVVAYWDVMGDDESRTLDEALDRTEVQADLANPDAGV